jgi:hypothetical protein
MFYFNISINYCAGCKYSPDSLLRGLQVQPAPVARVGSALAYCGSEAVYGGGEAIALRDNSASALPCDT